MTLEIKNLTVEIESKKIIKDLNLQIPLGNVYALMGKNGSGKSTLANVLAGNPKYKITKGKILFNKKNIFNQVNKLYHQNKSQDRGFIKLFRFTKKNIYILSEFDYNVLIKC